MSYAVLFLLLFVTDCKSASTTRICISKNENLSLPYCQEVLDIDELMQYDFYKLPNETELNFVTSHYTLTGVLTFTNKTALTLRGANQTAHLYCSNGAGLIFTHVAVVKIENMNFDDCGASSNGRIAAVAIQQGQTVEMSYVTVINSISIGLYLANISKNITVTSLEISNVSINIELDSSRNNTGVYLDSSIVDGAKYKFQNCTFKNSVAKKNSTRKRSYANRDYYCPNHEVGGGMTIKIRGVTKNLEVELILCSFDSNAATLGGGLLISMINSTQNNNIKIVDSNFVGNYANWKGGGAFINYIQHSKDMTANKVQFISCNFTRNKAMHGGAVYMSASPDYHSCEAQNNILFENCIWTENQATLGSAVHVKPYTSNIYIEKGTLPVPHFSNCLFEHNTVAYITQMEEAHYSVKIFGKGTVYSNELDIEFRGAMTFSQNNGSAVFLVSSILTINNSTTTFESNVGYNGGGVAMLRNSVIHLGDYAYVCFENNSATSYGGGIYHETYNDPFESGIHRCFIKYTGSNIIKKHFEVIFINNTVRREKRTNSDKLKGLSIYLYSLAPCIDNSHNGESVEVVLNSIANINFWDFKSESDVSTLASHYKDVDKLPVSFIPGEENNLNIVVEDDTDTRVSQVTYSAVLIKQSKQH